MIDKKNIQKHFIETTAKTITDFGMLKEKDTVLAAVSGGPDSVALVLSLLDLKEKYAIKISIVHLNHMLRGEESLRDELFVKELSHKLNLPFHGEQKDVNTYAKKHGLSIEEAGREARYQFFDSVAKTRGYTKIAFGHNKDDNAELVLMNLLRGSGPKGLSGIPPIRNGKYIRPLIRISKKEILEFLKHKKQAYMFDSSNKNIAYLRNNIRYNLIPHLESEYNPEIKGALDRLSNIVRQEDDFLDKETKKVFYHSLIKSKGSSIIFSKSKISTLHPALLNRVLRMAIKKIKNDLKRISFVHIDDIIEFCFNTLSGISLDLPGQIRVYKDKDVLMIKKEKKTLREIGKKEKQLRRMTKKKQGKES